MSKYNLKEHKDEIITHIIKNLIWLPIAAAIPIVYALLNFLYQSIKSSINVFSIILLIILCVLLVSFIIVVRKIFTINHNSQETLEIKRLRNEIQNSTNKIIILESEIEKRNKEINECKRKDLELDIKFTSIKCTLEFENKRESIISTIDYKMIALSEDVEEINRDLIWSGSEYKGTVLTEKDGDYELIDSNRKSSPYPYIIKFNTPLKRGSQVHFKTETSVSDRTLCMLPTYSFMVKYQVDNLELRIVAPNNFIKNVKKAVYADRAREICVEQPTLIKSRELKRGWVEYIYLIPNPSMLYNYFIEWEFTN